MKLEVTQRKGRPAESGRPVVVPAPGGAELGAREHAATEPAGVVIILGAMATPSRFYARFADHLARRGLTVVRFDYRGVGASRDGSLRRAKEGVLDWTVGDVESVLAWARKEYAGLRLAVLGHSLGGQAIGISKTAHQADAFVLVASQSGWVGHWPGLSRLRMELLWRAIVPTVTRAYGYLPGWTGIGEDVPARVANEWAGWCTTPGYVTGVVPSSELHFRDVRGPVLAWSFSDDDYAPRGSIEELLSWMDGATIEHKHLQPGDVGPARIGHFGFFKEGATSLWDETADWLRARLSR